jgi:hypothetical protein
LDSSGSDVSCALVSSASFHSTLHYPNLLQGRKVTGKHWNVSRSSSGECPALMLRASSPDSRFGFHNFVRCQCFDNTVYYPWVMTANCSSTKMNFISNTPGRTGNGLIHMYDSPQKCVHVVEDCVFFGNSFSCYFCSQNADNALVVRDCKFDVSDLMQTGNVSILDGNIAGDFIVFHGLTFFSTSLCPTFSNQFCFSPLHNHPLPFPFSLRLILIFSFVFNPILK